MLPRYQGIDTSFLVATLTAAIQEQQAIITALTTRITALEAKWLKLMEKQLISSMPCNQICNQGRTCNCGVLTMPSILKSKTVWYAIIIAVLSIVQGYIGLLPMTPVAQMVVGIAISVGIVILRLLTTQPIGEK